MALKAQQSSFTFSVPKTTSPPSSGFAPGAFNSDPMMFSRSPSSFSSASSTFSPSNPLDFSSLQAFDPSVLNLLDEPPQPTATSSAMNMDFGFGPNNSDDNSSKNTFLNNYTVIANNPQFLSLASMFDEASPSTASSTTSPPIQPQQQTPPETNAFNFDLSSLTSWPRDTGGGGDLDDIFGGFMGGTMDLGGYGDGPGSSAISPIVHHEPPHGLISMSNHSPASSSPESQKSDSMFTPIESSSESEAEGDHHDCPKTRSEFVDKIQQEGQSPFTRGVVDNNNNNNDADTCATGAPGSTANLGRKKDDHVACQTGSTFPKTDKSPQNIEVLNAWKKITAAPGFKVIRLSIVEADAMLLI